MKALEDLAGNAIEIVVSDPWDFVTDNGSGPFAGVVDRVEGECLLIRLERAIEHGGQPFEHLVVSPRSTCDDLAELSVTGRSINCNLVGVSGEAARSDHAGDLSTWRSDLALLGNIRSVNGDD